MYPWSGCNFWLRVWNHVIGPDFWSRDWIRRWLIEGLLYESMFLNLWYYCLYGQLVLPFDKAYNLFLWCFYICCFNSNVFAFYVTYYLLFFFLIILTLDHFDYILSQNDLCVFWFISFIFILFLMYA